jgi:hypothetical protein
LVIALVLNKPLNERVVQLLEDSLKPATIMRIVVAKQPPSIKLSDTDLRIIKSIIRLGARCETSEIAKIVRISEKTVLRRITRMKEGRVLEFTLQ